MTSRISVIPLFFEQIKGNKSTTFTDPKMSTYMMNLDETVDLALFSFEHGKNGDIFV
jgi:UDP-glucose 4-epimerase